MTHHSTSFQIERPVPTADAAKDLLPDTYDKAAPEKPASSAPDQAAPAAKPFNLRKTFMAGAAWYGWDYWTVGRFHVSTDDAYVKADNTTISPKVSGYLDQVLVGDN